MGCPCGFIAQRNASAVEGLEQDARVVPAEAETVGERHLDVHLQENTKFG